MNIGDIPAYVLTRAAMTDISDIWLYIADDNPAAADALENDFFATFEKLARMPSLGHWRRDLTDRPVRFLTVRRQYLIVYTPEARPLEIIRVLHGARNAGTILR